MRLPTTDPLEIARANPGVHAVEKDGRLLLFYGDELAKGRLPWTELALESRGSVWDAESGEARALPFRKFWNVGERWGMPRLEVARRMRTMPWRAFEKVDGALAVLRFDRGWEASGMRSFEGPEVDIALREIGLSPWGEFLRGKEGWTVLAEAVGEEIPSVVRAKPGLWFLGARELATGRMLGLEELEGWRKEARSLGIPVPRDLTGLASSLDGFEAVSEYAEGEGLVLWFADGELAKLKFRGYVEKKREAATRPPISCA